MATQTLDSHQTSTTDKQTEKLSSESVKVTEQINLSSPQETVEDDREKGRADNLHIPDSTLSTSKEKAVDIQVEPPVIEIEKIDEIPVVNLPVHDNVQLEKESTSVSEVATTTTANETLHEKRTPTEPVGGEATELPVIAYLEKSIKEFDATDNGKSPLEEQPTVKVMERETRETLEAPAQKVEQPSEVVDLPKLQDVSSSNIVYSAEKEKPGGHVHFVTEVAEKVETVSEKVEEKKPKIIDNTILSVVAHSSTAPTDAEEEPVSECVSVEKVPDKEPETDVPKEPVEQPKKEAQVQVVPLEELIEGVAKENFERVETPTEKEQPVEIHPFKGLEEAIAKEISIATEVPKEKQQGSEIEAEQESREVIETKINESVEVSHESEFPVEVHQAKEQVVIEKETNESFEPPKNMEQAGEAVFQKESVEVTTKEVGSSFELPKNYEQAEEGFSATKSGEVKEKETNDSTLGFKEVEKQEKEVIEVKDGIRELAEITKHVQDTYVEAETVTDEKPLAPGDNTGLPIEGKIQREEGSDKQNSVCEIVESGPTKDSVEGSEKEQPATESVSTKKETELKPETTCLLEEFVEPPKKEKQPIEIVAVKEPAQVFAKEDIETIELPVEKKQPVVVAKEISEDVVTVEPPIETKQSVVVAKEIIEDIETVEPPIEKTQPVVVEKEISEVVTKEVTQKIEPPTEKQQSEVIAKEISEVVAKEVMETSEPPTEKEQPVVTAKKTSASIEPLMDKEQPNEVISKESMEVIAQEVCASFNPPKNNEQAEEGFLVSESGKRPEVDNPSKEFVSVNKELREKPDTTSVPGLFVEPPKNEVHPIEVLAVEEQVEVITKEIIATTEPPTEKEQSIEVHPLKESEEATKIKITEPTELPKEKEGHDVHLVQQSRDVTTDKIGAIAEIPKENELLTEVHLLKESEVISEGTSDSTEPPKNKDQYEVLSHKEPLEVMEKETSASFEPPKNKEADEGPSQTESLEVIAKEISASFESPKKKEQADEGFLQTESGEMKGQETIEPTLGSEEVVKHEPQIIDEKDSVGELPELIKHVQNAYVEELALEDDINPPTEGGKVQEEETQSIVESDEQTSMGQVAKSSLVDDSGKDLEREQTGKEQQETIHVPELSIDPPKKEDLVEVIPSEHVEVIEEKRVEAVELQIEKEQPNGVHLPKGSEVVEKKITEIKELPNEKEQAVEVQSVQESKEVIAENISESVEIPKGSELLIEVQPLKELEVMVKETSESIKPPRNKEQPNEAPREKESEIIAKDISESFIPSKDMEQADEAFPVIGYEEMGAKEVSGSTLGPEEIEKPEPQDTEVRDGKEKLPEITNHVQNDYAEVETEPVKGEKVKDQKSSAIGDDRTPPLGVGEFHKEEGQCTVKVDKQDSVYQRGQPSVELVAPDFPPHDAKEDEKEESSHVDVVAQLSVVGAPAMEKVGEENEEKGVRTEKENEDTHVNIQKITLPREEVAQRDYETDGVVAGKSIDNQKAGEVVDLVAETKVEESITDEKLAPVETVNAQVNETPNEPQDFELEVKDEKTVRARGEVPKVNDKKEVPSKPSHKHSHNILSKVKQSLVKAKKAIIGKSPSSKTLSSEAKDDIKVK